jgi:hypothetical protein
LSGNCLRVIMPRHQPFPSSTHGSILTRPLTRLASGGGGSRIRLFFRSPRQHWYITFINHSYIITLIHIHKLQHPITYIQSITQHPQWQRPAIESLLWPMSKTVSHQTHTHTIEHPTDRLRQDSIISICFLQGICVRHYFFPARSPRRR